MMLCLLSPRGVDIIAYHGAPPPYWIAPAKSKFPWPLDPFITASTTRPREHRYRRLTQTLPYPPIIPLDVCIYELIPE